MNNEKQHSEYKIIETVATPTFDGVSVETHPEDQFEGGDTPIQETLWKYHSNYGGAYFAGEMQISGDNCEISVYGVNQTTYYILNEKGKIQGSSSLTVETILNNIKSAAEISINKKVVKIGIIQSEYNVGDILSDFNNYLDIS